MRVFITWINNYLNEFTKCLIILTFTELGIKNNNLL